MTETYPLTGLTCQGCAAKVKNELLKVPEVTAVSISLAPLQATISTDHPVPASMLKAAVNRAGHYDLIEPAGALSVSNDSSKDRTWFETYKPLLLIAVFIAGTSLVTSTVNGEFQPYSFMRFLMAGFFIVFSFFKFLDLKGFATSYAMYDVLASRWSFYGSIYPFLELGLGISYLTDFQPRLTAWVTIVLMGFSSIGVIQSVLNKRKIKCACLGAVFQLPMSTVTIVEDLLMVGMAGGMLIFG